VAGRAEVGADLDFSLRLSRHTTTQPFSIEEEGEWFFAPRCVRLAPAPNADPA